MAKKRVPNLEDDGQDCGAGGGVGDEEALDHPMKPFAVQQKEEAATRQMMEGGGEQASEGERRGLLQKVQERVQEERGRALLLLQVSEEGERRVVGRQPGRGFPERIVQVVCPLRQVVCLLRQLQQVTGPLVSLIDLALHYSII